MYIKHCIFRCLYFSGSVAGLLSVVLNACAHAVLLCQGTSGLRHCSVNESRVP